MPEDRFERVEPRLYLKRHRSVRGEMSTLYYGVFFCRLKGKQRFFPLGSELKVARDELKILEARNVRREDFDLDRIRPEPEPQRLTLSGFIPRFLETKKGIPSYGFYKSCCNHLGRILGQTLLEEITRTRIVEYKIIRQGEPIIRQGKAVEGSAVKSSTVNREIATLSSLLNVAVEDGILDKIPAMKKLKEPEDHLARERILDTEEYYGLLEASPLWLKRVIVAAYEACLSRVDLLGLNWEEVNRKRPEAAVIKLVGGRNKTKARQKVPICPELNAILDEIEGEREKLSNIDDKVRNLVFTRNGKLITRNVLRKEFDKAKAKAGVHNFHFHDFRHCAVTRWTMAGIPEDLQRLAAGHSRGSVHQRYVNPPDEQMFEVFAKHLGWTLRYALDRDFAS